MEHPGSLLECPAAKFVPGRRDRGSNGWRDAAAVAFRPILEWREFVGLRRTRRVAAKNAV
jgi:hypothetical protein